MSSRLRNGHSEAPPFAGGIPSGRASSPAPLLGTPSEDAPRIHTLIDQFLAEQQDLSAADQFSRWHDQPAPLRSEPALASHYRKLIPLTPPRPGEQYAFEVDLDACSGCKACVTACHSLNGLEEGETWRSVGLLIDQPPALRLEATKPPLSTTALQHVTTACHHCVDPGCLNGCPVLAYEKDPATGIVRHLDDQCIGCSYCTLMCPYEVPKYSQRLGIVRKCDLCHDRLASGEAPACVQGCPNGAIRVALVETAPLRAALRPMLADAVVPKLVPDAPDSSFTLPATRYLSRSGRIQPLAAADRAQAVPAHAHSPLTLFLVLSQFSVGVLAVASLQAGPGTLAASAAIQTSLLLQVVSLAIATSHLGRPLRAWRSFLGWRRSWFSREVLAFGAYTQSLALLAAATLGFPVPLPLLGFAGLLAPLLGLVAVGTSTMIYAATQRAFWRVVPTSARFFGTVALLGGITLASPGAALAVTITALAIKFLAEFECLVRDPDDPASELGRTRLLLLGPLRWLVLGRLALATLGIVCIALRLAPISVSPTMLTLLAGVVLVAAELLERHLFFVAVSPQRMPGGVPS